MASISPPPVTLEPTARRPRILVVDDEPSIRESLRIVLGKEFDVTAADGGRAAISRCAEAPPDLVLLDIMMPDLDGITTLERLKTDHPELVVVMLTAVTEIKTVVEAMRRGAEDYVSKPFEIGELRMVLTRALERRALRDEVQRLRGQLADRFSFHRIVGHSKGMQAVYNTIEQVAERRSTVLIQGESGTGKELVARAIHFTGGRAAAPFVVVNCAAIAETLLESQLFGHEKGAFTDARERRDGQFVAADGGTIFLDEIGEMPAPMQAKLLRVLQEREVLPVGATQPTHVDVRIITATNRVLHQLVEGGRFREDLYYRINVVPIQIPTLRERREDIPRLLEHFIARASEHDRQLELTPDAIDALVAYDWPGNVRELENTIERLVALAPHDRVAVEDLPQTIRSTGGLDNERAESFRGRLDFEEAVREFEGNLINEALRRAQNVQTSAAQMLGISRRMLKYKMDKYGLG